MFLVAGLGNPGEEYALTPHNLGFLTIDRLAERYGIRVTRPDSRALVGTGEIDGQPVRRTVISIDSEKTGMRVKLPLLPQLQATLDAGPTGDLAFIVTRRGTPWNKGALGTEFVAPACCGGDREIRPRHAQGGGDAGCRERGNRA